MNVAENRPPTCTLPGEWEPNNIYLDPPNQSSTTRLLGVGSARVIESVLTADDCDRLIGAMMQQRLAPVSVSGNTRSDSDAIGSFRATAWDPILGDQLWEKISHGVPGVRLMTDMTATDWYAMPETSKDPKRMEHRVWESCGVSPVLRFMRYEAGGEHNTHYDMGYDYEGRNFSDKRRTLMSIVFYLTTCELGEGGCTRFIKDGQEKIPVPLRNHDGWTRRSREDELIAAVRPIRGSVLIFDHRQAHDVEKYLGSSPRIIIRGDIVFRALD